MPDTMKDNLKKKIIILSDKIIESLNSKLAEVGLLFGKNLQANHEYEQLIKPHIIEAVDFLTALKGSKLERYTDVDLNNIVACLSCGFEKNINENFQFLINEPITQATRQYVAGLIKVSCDNFFYGIDKANPDWHRSLIDIINKRNALDLQAVPTNNKLLDKGSKKEDLDEYVKIYNAEGRKNFGYMCVCLVAMVCLIYLEYVYCLSHLLEIPINSVLKMEKFQFYLLIMKNIFNATLFFTLLYYLMKLILIFLNNYLINREKSLALSSSKWFITAYDEPEIRNATISTVIKTVLDPRNTGLIKNEGMNDSVSNDFIKYIDKK